MYSKLVEYIKETCISVICKQSTRQLVLVDVVSYSLRCAIKIKQPICWHSKQSSEDYNTKESYNVQNILRTAMTILQVYEHVPPLIIKVVFYIILELESNLNNLQYGCFNQLIVQFQCQWQTVALYFIMKPNNPHIIQLDSLIGFIRFRSRDFHYIFIYISI